MPNDLRLAQLPGEILLSVHMGNFSPVDQYEIQETKPYWNINLYVHGYIYLTLKMTSAQVVETSVTNNSSFQNYTHPDDHTIRTAIYTIIYLTNRFHVAVCLFSNRSQKTSKCGKNISDTLDYRLMCHFFVLTTF